MTYQNNGDYRLANKLKREFYGRGQHLSGMQASSTSELMKRAEMGKDPRVNCSEEAFRENYRNYRGGAKTYADRTNSGRTSRENPVKRTNAKNSSTYKKQEFPG